MKAASTIKLEQCSKKVKAITQYKLIGKVLTIGVPFTMLVIKVIRIL